MCRRCGRKGKKSTYIGYCANLDLQLGSESTAIRWDLGGISKVY